MQLSILIVTFICMFMLVIVLNNKRKQVKKEAKRLKEKVAVMKEHFE